MEYFAVIRVQFQDWILTASETARYATQAEAEVQAERLQTTLSAQAWIRVQQSSMQIRKEAVSTMYQEIYSDDNGTIAQVKTDKLGTFPSAY